MIYCVKADCLNIVAGVDVMIAIYGDFCQFSAKNDIFVKKQCYDHFFAKTSGSLSKNANIFGESIFKNRNIGPRLLTFLTIFLICTLIAFFERHFSSLQNEPNPPTVYLWTAN
jgi:hypothetical protein